MSDTSGAAGTGGEQGTSGEQGEQGGQNGTPGQGQQGGQPQGQQGAQSLTPEQQAQRDGTDIDRQDPTSLEDAIAEINRLRRVGKRYQTENASRRVRGRDEEQAHQRALRDLARLAGAELPDEEPAGVEQVTAALTATATERDDARAQSAILAGALAAGVDPARLEYLEFAVRRSPEFGALDATAADYRDRVSTIVAAQVTKDATLLRSGISGGGASGAESMAGSSGTSAITPEAFAAMTVAQRTDLYRNDRATYDRLSGRSNG